jgi:hypothetical protein
MGLPAQAVDVTMTPVSAWLYQVNETHLFLL